MTLSKKEEYMDLYECAKTTTLSTSNLNAHNSPVPTAIIVFSLDIEIDSAGFAG